MAVVETPCQFIRVSIQGIIAGGERWSINPVFWAFGWPGGDYPPEVFQAMADAVAAVDVPAGLQNLLSNQASVTSVRLDGISNTEIVTKTASAALNPAQSGSGAPSCPRTTAVVVSLRTAAPGASNRGRLYWPTLQLPIDSNTVNIAPNVQTTIVEAMRDYLSAIQDAININELPGLTYDLAVWSRTNHSGRPVTRLAVGNQPDSQRRRKDAIIESYVSSAYPSP